MKTLKVKIQKALGVSELKLNYETHVKGWIRQICDQNVKATPVSRES